MKRPGSGDGRRSVFEGVREAVGTGSPGVLRDEPSSTTVVGVVSHAYFRPPGEFVLGIRGGPILPADIVTSDALDRPLVPEPGRYAIVYSPVTPSGQKVALVAALYGLLDVVSVRVAGAGRLAVAADSPAGYRWSQDLTAGEREALEVGGLVRTPALVDTAAMEVLSNDPYRMPYELRDLARTRPPRPAGPGVLSLAADVPAELHWDARIFEEFHAGVYRAGFVTEPSVYERTVAGVHRFLVDLDRWLADHAHLYGDGLAPSDLWLFSLLVRFDQVYSPGFRLHRYRIRDLPSVWRYLRQLYQIPACSFTTDFTAISAGYFLGIPALNRGIVPIGPDDLFLRG